MHIEDTPSGHTLKTHIEDKRRHTLKTHIEDKGRHTLRRTEHELPVQRAEKRR